MRFLKTLDGYCWEAENLDDYHLAPFHILAAEGQVFSDHSHNWHMEVLGKLSEHDPILITTRWERFNAENTEDCERIIAWWQDHTHAGQEGLVVKPTSFIAKCNKGFVQPAMKVSGPDYLRIIYGPDYDLPENLEGLRERGLSRKCSFAMREFFLGLEELYHFVEHKLLIKVHECAQCVLALESDPVDPRL